MLNELLVIPDNLLPQHTVAGECIECEACSNPHVRLWD